MPDTKIKMEKKARILVIDDDPDIGMMIKLMLEYKGYKVTVLDKAGKIEEFLRNGNIDMVIMDMLLSGTNGIDICTGLKSDPAISHIPLIMMSAHPDAKKNCLDAGADDFVSKPFDMQDMLAKISTLINRKNNS